MKAQNGSLQPSAEHEEVCGNLRRLVRDLRGLRVVHLFVRGREHHEVVRVRHDRVANRRVVAGHDAQAVHRRGDGDPRIARAEQEERRDTHLLHEAQRVVVHLNAP